MKYFAKTVVFLTLFAFSFSYADVLINEFDTNTSSSEYLELFNTTGADIDLAASGYVLVFVNGYDDKAYQATDLTGTLPANGFFVIAESGVTEVEGYTPDQNGTWTSFQNGTDGVALVLGAAASDFPGDDLFSVELAAATGASQLDAIIYDDATSDTGLETEFGLTGILIINGSSGSSSRVTDGQGGAAYANTDWHITATRTPGATNVAAPPTYTPYTIAQIQDTTGTGADGSAHDGEYVETYGVVTAATSYSYWLQNGTGAWNGVYVYASGGTVGDSITVVGTVDEYYGLTEIKNLTSTTVHASGVTLPAATVLTTAAAGAEAYEGVLINVSGTCTDNDIGNGEWELDDGSGVLVVDDIFFDVLPTVGYEYDVTGPQTYSYSAYKIEPRDADDVVETVTDLNEPNDNLATATAIAGNDTLDGIIDPADDVDFFTFTLTEESEVTIDLFISGYSSLDGEVALFSSDSTNLDSDDSGFSGGDEQVVAVLDAGTYYIGAADWSDLRASTGAYALGFFAEPYAGAPQGSTCDDPIALTLPAVALAGTTEGFGDDYGTSPCNSSYMGGDDIVYEFTLAEDGYLTGAVDGSWAGLHILDDCPDASPTCIASGTGSSGGGFSLVPITAGTYYAIVSNWPSPQFITFTLDLSFDTSLPQGTECDNPFVYGAVNDPAVVDTLLAGEIWWYSFDVVEELASLTVSLCGTEFDSKLGVWESCDSTDYIAYNDDGCSGYPTGSSYASEIVMVDVAPGTYYAKVYGYSSSSNGEYTLAITGETVLVAPDFVVTSMTMDADTLNVVVTNQGTADSPGYYGTDYHGLYIDGVYQGYVVESGVALAIGASHTYSVGPFNYYSLGDSGDFEIVFECDTDDDVLELDETNNLDTLEIHIDLPPAAPINFVAEGGPGFNDLMWEPSPEDLLPPAPVGMINNVDMKREKPELTTDRSNVLADKRLALGIRPFTRTQGDSCENPLVALADTNSAPYQPVWYEYTATMDGHIIVTSDILSQTTDTKVYVYSDCAGTEIGYDDDGGTGYTSVFAWNVATGTTYYIYWDDYWSSAAFDWELIENTGPLPAPDLAVTAFWSSADTVFAEVSNIGTDDAGSSNSCHWYVNGVDVGYAYTSALAAGESDTIGLYGLTYANFGPDTLEIGVELDYWDYYTELDEENLFIWDTDFVVPVPDYLPTYNVYREETTREFVLIVEDLDADDWAFNGYYRDGDVVGGTEYCYYATQNLPDASESVASNEDCATADPAGAVEGVVTDMATTLPMVGVSVEVTTIDGDFIALDSTDADGYYLVEYLPLGFSEIGFHATGFHAAGFGIVITDGDTVEQNITLVPDSMTQVLLYSTGFETGDDAGVTHSWSGNEFAITDTFFAPVETVLPADGDFMLAFPEQDSLTYANNDEAYWLGAGAGQIDVTGYEMGSLLLQVDALFETENNWDFFYLAVMLDDGNIYWNADDGLTGSSGGWVTVTSDFSWIIDSGSAYFYPMIYFVSDGSVVSGWGGAFDNFKVLYDDFFNAPVADLAVTNYGANATLTWAAPAARGTVEYEIQRMDPDNRFEFDTDEGVVAFAKGPRPTETVTMIHEYSNPASRSLIGYKVYRQDNPFPLDGPMFLGETTDLTYTDATVVAGNYYDFAVTVLYDVGESWESIVAARIGAVTQVDPFAEDFEGLTAIPTGWEAFTTSPDGITWTVGDSAAADSAFGAVGVCPAHTDFAFIEDGRGNGVAFEALLLSPFIDASDMFSALASFSGYEQGYADFGNTWTQLLVRADMGEWHVITDFSYDHNAGWVDYLGDIAEIVAGEEYVQFAFYYEHQGLNSGGGNGMAVDDFDLFGIAGPTNLTAAGTQGQIELNWSEPGARSQELIRGNVVSRQITMDKTEIGLVPGPVYDNRDACYSNWLPAGWFTGFYGPDSGYTAPTLATLFEFPVGPMTLEMAIHHGIWYNADAPFPDTVRAFITVATTDLAGVTQTVIESDTVFYILESGYYFAATLDLVGLDYQQTDSSYLKVAVELLDDAYYSNFDANVWMPPLRIDDPNDDINSGLSGYDSLGIFQQDDTYDWFLEICGTPTPPALRYNVYRDDEFIAGPLEEMTYTDEDVAALVDYDYFVTGYVPIVLASDNPGGMIFVDTDSSNHDVAAAPNTPPTAPALAVPADNFTVMVNNLTGAAMFVWSPAADADPGQTVEYDFELTLGTNTWAITTDQATVSISYQELYTEIFDNQGAAALTGTWNVVATDGLDDTPASNGPRNITVDVSIVGVDQGAQVPDVFALHQNYPNPFNPTTTINYDIPEISNVRIEIYNLLGQKVRSLVNSEHAPAYYQVQWDGTTDAGAVVASGMYIYRIEAGSFSAIRKLVIMK